MWRMRVAGEVSLLLLHEIQRREHGRALPLRRIFRQDLVELRRRSGVSANGGPSATVRRSDCWNFARSYTINGWKLIDPRLP